MRTPLLIFALCMLLFSSVASAQEKDELDKYIQHLKDDNAGPRKETGFLSAGSDFLYGQGYFDAKNYSSAEWYFMDVVKKQKDNAFANYQLAISLIRQNDAAKKQQAQEYLDAAFRLNPSLKDRYQKDVPAGTITATQTTPANNPPATSTPPANNPPNNNPVTTNLTGLDAYIDRLKRSSATFGAETAMNTAGQEALYGIGYYEKNDLGSAETRFRLALARDAEQPYINYMMAISLAAQGNKEAAKPFLQKAFAKDASLVRRYDNDLPKAMAEWKKLEDAKQVKTSPPTKETYGGRLVFGNYTCHQSVWNGPNRSPAYSFQYKGYFALKADGTYRWLDNGQTGRYKYDAKTGNITWLSGYFKTSGVKSTQYKVDKEMAQATVNFSESYRWECGCERK
ncbi:tetratricopeptide repeat protein [Aridibaculum aurantiacum]|uniref:tetratricopeptide repeat protein n=1 Tax=Aridibaculum aurantiacum TaxID=2810307 RepID=UPI001A97A099|nr:hypothetical protein [Aridibaculum aurantiacum]